MANWRHEIFNYFDQRLTNAATESLNGLAKIMNRLGRGYSFDVLRARLLLNYRHQKFEAPRVSRTFPGFGGTPGNVSTFATQTGSAEPRGRLLGIDISTLMEELDHDDENPEINP
jgi:transposase